MTIKLTNSIKVGPYDYDVVHKHIEDHEEVVGDFNSTKSRIRITTNLNDRRTVETLLHEIVHSIFYSYALSAAGVPDDKEEIIVSLVSTGLAAIIRDNPEWAHQLVDTLCKE